MLKLTDTQLLLLSQASQRDDLHLTLPASLKGGAVQVVADKLLKLQLVEETPASAGVPVWRTDDGQPIALVMTQTGLEAIGIEPAGGEMVAQPHVPPPTVKARSIATGTKQVAVLAMLSDTNGASIAELTAATGWLAHTTRAALTGLRKKGHIISRSPRPDGTTAYHLLPVLQVSVED